MKNVGENIIKCLQKNQEALQRFQARKEAFLATRKQTTRDIEEARNIWLETLKQLPGQEFSDKKGKINKQQATGMRNFVSPLTQKRINPFTHKRINP